MLLSSTCKILKNFPMKDHMAVSGINELRFLDDNEMILDTHIHSDVLWTGKGSPYPTPPGGPWKTDPVTDGKKYSAMYKKVGKCFYVASTREEGTFIHLAMRVSMGCFLVDPKTSANFWALLWQYAGQFDTEQREVLDLRSDAERRTNPIDYSKMIKKIQ